MLWHCCFLLLYNQACTVWRFVISILYITQRIALISPNLIFSPFSACLRNLFDFLRAKSFVPLAFLRRQLSKFNNTSIIQFHKIFYKMMLSLLVADPPTDQCDRSICGPSCHWACTSPTNGPIAPLQQSHNHLTRWLLGQSQTFLNLDIWLEDIAPTSLLSALVSLWAYQITGWYIEIDNIE